MERYGGTKVMPRTPNYYRLVGKTLKYIQQHGKDYETFPTSIPGIFIIRFPNKKFFLEFLPIDLQGKPLVRKGYRLQYMNNFQAFKRMVNDPRTEKLLKTVLSYNPDTNKIKDDILNIDIDIDECDENETEEEHSTEED
jgi:hypothetical protein